MAMTATVKNEAWLIEKTRSNRMGFTERIVFTGAKTNVPKGWRVIRYEGKVSA